MEVTEYVHPLVRLHGSAQFGDMGGVEAVIVLVDGLVGCQLCVWGGMCVCVGGGVCVGYVCVSVCGGCVGVCVSVCRGMCECVCGRYVCVGDVCV